MILYRSFLFAGYRLTAMAAHFCLTVAKDRRCGCSHLIYLSYFNWFYKVKEMATRSSLF